MRLRTGRGSVHNARASRIGPGVNGTEGRGSGGRVWWRRGAVAGGARREGRARRPVADENRMKEGRISRLEAEDGNESTGVWLLRAAYKQGNEGTSEEVQNAPGAC